MGEILRQTSVMYTLAADSNDEDRACETCCNEMNGADVIRSASMLEAPPGKRLILLQKNIRYR
jgi:hypothetical protein